MITVFKREGNFQNSLPWLIWYASLLPNDIGEKAHNAPKIITFELKVVNNHAHVYILQAHCVAKN